MTPGTRLRKYRDTKRFSQKEVAERIGISQTTYCNWENDNASYQVKYLPLLAQLFEVSVLELIPEIGNNTKALNGHLPHENQPGNDKNVIANQVYADLLRSREETIESLKDENSRLKTLIDAEM